MISLGLIDVLLIIILVAAFIHAVRTRALLLFAIVLILVFFVELERFAPGSFIALQRMVQGIDKINDQLPHIRISPIVTIK